MNETFDLTHTIEIADIHDMITVNIQPMTNCERTPDAVQINGHLDLRGTYLTEDLGEAPFETTIPVDLTLPLRVGGEEVEIDIRSFDYTVCNKESLTVKIDAALLGYDNTAPLVSVVPTIEEATFAASPLDVALDDVANDATLQTKAAALDVSHVQEKTAEPVAIVKPPKVEPTPMTYYSPPVPIMRDVKLPIDHHDQTPRADAAPQETALKTPEDFPTTPSEVITPNRPTVTETVLSTPDVAPALEVRPDPITAEPVETLFEARKEEMTTAPTEEAITPTEEVVEMTPGQPSIVNEIARQFSDGRATIKMVYVSSESETLNDILSRFEATLEDVWNLSRFENGIAVGDCVMIRAHGHTS